MRIVLVVGHPDARSYNLEIAELLCRELEAAGHQVDFHDLYREDFDPRLPQEEIRRRSSFDALPARYAAELRSADGLVIVHPDWWGLPPAIVKGWVDRVFLPGIAYVFEEGVRIPLLESLRAAVIVTRDGPEEGLCGEFWLKRVFEYCGISPGKFIDIGPLKTETGPDLKLKKEEAVKEILSFTAE